MTDPHPKAPSFFRTIGTDSSATSAQFERVPHPRVTAPLHAPVSRQSPPPPSASTPAEQHAAALPTPPLSPLAQMSFPTPPPLLREPRNRDATLQQLEEAIRSLRLHASRLAELARSDALEIGFQVARRILETELSTSAEPLFSLVRSAVRRVGDARKMVIRLHPDDAKRVDTPEARGELGLSMLQLEVIADSSLSLGDTVLETDNATVDGRLSTRLGELKRAVNATAEGELK